MQVNKTNENCAWEQTSGRHLSFHNSSWLLGSRYSMLRPLCIALVLASLAFSPMNVQASAPQPTFTPTEPPTQTPTETATEIPTQTPTETATETPTETSTEIPEQVSTETPTQTPTETSTEIPEQVSTETPTQTPTQTPTDTFTETPIPECSNGVDDDGDDAIDLNDVGCTSTEDNDESDGTA